MHRSLVAASLVALLAGCGEGFVDGEGRSLANDVRRPPEEFAASELQSPLSSGGATLFLNFDGDTLAYGQSYSKGHTTWLVPKAKGKVTFPAFSTRSLGNIDRQTAINQIVAAVQKDYAAWNLTVVTTRPSSGDYTEVVIGGNPSLIDEDQTTAGISPLDEGNPNKNDIVLVFADILDTLHDISDCISHEGGHSFGLDHLKPKDAIMYPVLQPGSLKFEAGYTYDDNVWQDEPALLTAALGARPTSAQPPPSTTPASTDDSVFVSQTVPASVDAGSTFTVKVTFKNTGTSTWTAKDGFGVMTSDMTWGGNRAALGSTVSVKPGSQYTFSLSLKAPAAAGTYGMQWQVAKNATLIGKASTSVQVTVKGAAGTQQKAPPTGEFESLAGNVGKGWAFDGDAPSAAVRIDVYIDGNYAGYVTANRSRTDLVTAGKIPNAAHGFAFSLPTSASGTHTVELYGVDDSDGYAYKIGNTLSYTN